MRCCGSFDNSSLTWGLVACGAAQLSKLVLELILHVVGAAVLVETGGMPSSHSALVTGTARASAGRSAGTTRCLRWRPWSLSW